MGTLLVLFAQGTLSRNDARAAENERYRLLVSELQRELPTPPPGSRIYLFDGPWTGPWDNLVWLPTISKTLYGTSNQRSPFGRQGKVRLRNVRPGECPIFMSYPDPRMYVLRYYDQSLHRLPAGVTPCMVKPAAAVGEGWGY